MNSTIVKRLVIASATISLATSAALIASSPLQNTNVAYAKAKAVTLGSGTYKVGRDIKPGRYLIQAQSGSGNFTSSISDINIILGTDSDDDLGQVTSYTATLPKGDKIKIDDIESVTFTPVTKRSYQTTLNAGQWEVGKDIRPGRYVIKGAEGSGNLTDDLDDINEIIGTSADSDEGQITKTTQTLHRGATLNTDAQQIKLIKK